MIGTKRQLKLLRVTQIAVELNYT